MPAHCSRGKPNRRLTKVCTSRHTTLTKACITVATQHCQHYQYLKSKGRATHFSASQLGGTPDPRLTWTGTFQHRIAGTCSWGLTSTATSYGWFGTEESGGGGGGRLPMFYRLPATLSPPEWLCIQADSCVMRTFNVLLIVWAKSQDRVH